MSLRRPCKDSNLGHNIANRSSICEPHTSHPDDRLLKYSTDFDLANANGSLPVHDPTNLHTQQNVRTAKHNQINSATNLLMDKIKYRS